MTNNFSTKFNQFNKGFTLVETLVAISIFTMSIIALMSVLASGISNTNYAKTKITASYLAQEGIEYARNKRDTSVLYDTISAQNGWNIFLTPSFSITYPSPDPSFTRVLLKTIINADQVKISSTVSWMQGSGLYQITFSENLFNWIQ
jgi:Tfp pilus assembly protein PilV